MNRVAKKALKLPLVSLISVYTTPENKDKSSNFSWFHVPQLCNCNAIRRANHIPLDIISRITGPTVFQITQFLRMTVELECVLFQRTAPLSELVLAVAKRVK